MGYVKLATIPLESGILRTQNWLPGSSVVGRRAPSLFRVTGCVCLLWNVPLAM